MGRCLKARKPTRAEFLQLNEWMEESEQPWQRRRASILVYYASGLSTQDIAAAVGVHPNTVYAVVHAFEQRGMAAVTAPVPRGAPSRVRPDQVAEMRRLADLSPTEVGLPHGRWSLANLRDYLIKKRIVKGISREHLRRLLKKGGFVFAVSGES